MHHSKKLQIFRMHFCLCGIGLESWKKFSKKYLDMILSRGKSDKNGIFDVVTSCSIFDKYTDFFEEYFLMSCYQNKHIGLALLFVIYEFEASKKCQVSLVFKYLSF